MLCDGRVMCLAAETFRGLAERIGWCGGSTQRARCTRHRPVGASARSRCDCACWPVSWISATTYVFDGAAEDDRALAAFLATQRGVQGVRAARFDVDLNPQAGTVRSFAHARSACTESARSTDIGYVRLIAPSTSFGGHDRLTRCGQIARRYDGFFDFGAGEAVAAVRASLSRSNVRRIQVALLRGESGRSPCASRDPADRRRRSRRATFAHEFGRQLGDVVGRCDDEHRPFVFGHPRQHRCRARASTLRCRNRRWRSLFRSRPATARTAPSARPGAANCADCARSRRSTCCTACRSRAAAAARRRNLRPILRRGSCRCLERRAAAVPSADRCRSGLKQLVLAQPQPASSGCRDPRRSRTIRVSYSKCSTPSASSSSNFSLLISGMSQSLITPSAKTARRISTCASECVTPRRFAMSLSSVLLSVLTLRPLCRRAHSCACLRTHRQQFVVARQTQVERRGQAAEFLRNR